MTTVSPTFLKDAGGVRRIVARWVITADLVLESAAHFGGGPEGTADMTILRDAREGRPLLPGTSLAGALRSHLADVLGGYYRSEAPEVALLFGDARDDDLGRQSPLIVFDSLGKLSNDQTLEIRDGVQIEGATGTAKENKKFDFEILPAGTRFPLRFELVVSENADEGKLLRLLVTSLNGLASGDIALGMRRSRGLGALRAERWKAVRYDLSRREGWWQWLSTDPRQRYLPDDVPADDDPEAALRKAYPALKIATPPDDQRRRLLFELKLQLKSGLLVRSAPVEPDAPDVVHLQSAGSPVLPGTSLAGVLRARALRIARLVRGDRDDAERWVSGMFGPRREEVVSRSKEKLWASRLRISESIVKDGTRMRTTRVRIDRFTQGVDSSALFEEEPDYMGKVCIRMELRNPQPGEAGLLLLVLKDLMSGDLAVGGTASVGRGIFSGEGILIREDGSEVRLRLESMDPHEEKQLNEWIREFWEHPKKGDSACDESPVATSEC